MEAFLFGTVGFLLCILYDINSVSWRNRILNKMFLAGTLCITGSAFWTVRTALGEKTAEMPFCFIFAAGSLLFLGMLIYTLFFALPFEETYLEENRQRMAYTEGVYALCRHPGVLMFAGLFLCLWGMTGRISQGIYFLSMILWNYIYIILQDVWIFPETFTNYTEYKKTTPFLIPSRNSICRALKGRKQTEGEMHES